MMVNIIGCKTGRAMLLVDNVTLSEAFDFPKSSSFLKDYRVMHEQIRRAPGTAYDRMDRRPTDLRSMCFSQTLTGSLERLFIP